MTFYKKAERGNFFLLNHNGELVGEMVEVKADPETPLDAIYQELLQKNLLTGELKDIFHRHMNFWTSKK